MNKIRRFNVHTHQFKDEPTVSGVVIEFVGDNDIAAKLAETVERVLSECLAQPLFTVNELQVKTVRSNVLPIFESVKNIDSVSEYAVIERLIREKEGSWKEVKRVLLISHKELKKKLDTFGFEKRKQLMDIAATLTQQRYNNRKAKTMQLKRIGEKQSIDETLQ